VYRGRRRLGRTVALIVACVAVTLIGLSVAFVATSAYRAKDAGAAPLTVVIPAGSGTDDIARLLHERGITSSTTSFTVAVLLSGARGELQAGTYELSAAMSPADIVALVRSGSTKQHTVTIPEGLRLTEVADRLAEAGITTRGDFIDATREEYDYPFLTDLPAGADLEGFLFPDTYTFPEGTNAHDVVDRMLATFSAKITPLLSAIDESDLSLFEIVTLASIVEAEVPHAEDRTKAASVFLNRLGEDMRLQADSTVAYFLNVHRVDLTSDELATDDPYNTYVHTGLPPGPIGNPSLNAIESVLDPAESDLLYFVSNPETNETFFAETLEEHNDNIATVEEQLDQD